ncbi:MAG: hypothetical protein GXP34_09550, partial [Actinobacteria bacterium]|nr:hypothetical protein [Actinomycetota bacterium]
EQALLDGTADDVPWTAIDIHTGTLTPTGARYEPGTWTWVAPRNDNSPPTGEPDCSDWEGTYP